MNLHRAATIALALSLMVCTANASYSGSGTGASSNGGGSSGGGASSSGSGGPSSSGGSGTTLSINAVNDFLADAYHMGGSTYSTTNAIDTSLLGSAAPPASIFQTERYSEFTYTIPNRTPGTAQTVTLCFEESRWTAAGQRTFDVAIDGSTILTAFDIFAAAGGANRVIARTFTVTADAGGRVMIEFKRTGPDNPRVCALTVAGDGAPPAPKLYYYASPSGTGTAYSKTAQCSMAGLGAQAIGVTGCVFSQIAAGGIVIGDVLENAHHPSDPRILNKDITVTNTLIHHIGIDYRDSAGIFFTDTQGVLVSHNEVHDLPYSGINSGYGWGANDAGGADEYANRGLYYQPRCSTPTVARDNRIAANLIHHAQLQMNEGGCLYNLRRTPGRSSRSISATAPGPRCPGRISASTPLSSQFNAVFSRVGARWAGLADYLS